MFINKTTKKEESDPVQSLSSRSSEGTLTRNQEDEQSQALQKKNTRKSGIG